MEKEIFESKLLPLGRFKRKWAGISKTEGYEDIIFIPNKKKQSCPQCHEFVFTGKRGYKDRFYWEKKCVSCNTKTIVKSPK